MSSAKQFPRALVPAPFRIMLRKRHRRYVFWRATRAFLRDPKRFTTAQTSVVSDLVYGWDNGTWSAGEEYLLTCLKTALKTDGPILECGSGLTTIVIGAMAQKLGKIVYSLEHMETWGEKVTKYLRKYDIDSVGLSVNRLHDYGDFSWYSPPFDRLPDRFSLVVCDSPPGDTPGGRYGLLPIMRSRLAPGCTILLDDIAREDEQAIATRWIKDLNAEYEIQGSNKPFIQIVAPGRPRSTAIQSDSLTRTP